MKMVVGRGNCSSVAMPSQLQLSTAVDSFERHTRKSEGGRRGTAIAICTVAVRRR